MAEPTSLQDIAEAPKAAPEASGDHARPAVTLT